MRRLNYSYCETTLGGLPTGPAYERRMPDEVGPDEFGHEKVPYPMSDYDHLSFLPVGGLGAPLCEVDYTTCYLREGYMVQDEPMRRMSVSFNFAGQEEQQFDLAETEGTYYALYPFSERSYDLPIPFSILQYSPVIPGNYQSSSLPVEVIEVVAENTTDQPITITFSLNQDNFLGWYPQAVPENPANPHGRLIWNRQSAGNYAETFEQNDTVGLLLQRDGNHEENVRVGSGFAGQIALASRNTGNVQITTDPQSNTITLTIILQPGERISHPITFAFDNPFYHFQTNVTDPQSYGVRMPREYTRYYDTEGDNAQQIALDALNNYGTWREQIALFQAAIIDNPDLPSFVPQVLLNELYILTETGIWEADEGRFAFLESIDYKMYNTSDVNSYNWAIFMLFPELERRDLIELANLVPMQDSTRRWWGTDHWARIPQGEQRDLYWAPIHERGTVCHDLGGLLGEGVFPFTNRCNEFNWSNPNMWIDLAPKFALRVWRYVSAHPEDTEFLETVYPNVVLALDTLERRWANTETHVPVSKGIPDTTYDTLSGHGYNANVTMQWLAALEAAQNMAQMMEDGEAAERYAAWRTAGEPVVGLLWSAQSEDEMVSLSFPPFWTSDEGFEYFNAFVSPDGRQVNDFVHSDVLFGDFYARMTGLSPVVSDCQATRSMETIYFTNGELWSMNGNHGPLGLVNVRGTDGRQHFTEQGDEGWTGAMLLNAAYQIRVGRETGNEELVRQGWNIIFGFFNVVYSSSPDSQGWFGRTPEGYANPDDFRFNDHDRRYSSETGRAPKYMRALAIWAVLAAVLE